MASPDLSLTCPSCTGGIRLISDGRGMMICPECQTLVAIPEDRETTGPTPPVDLITPSQVARSPTPAPGAPVTSPFSGAFLSQYELLRPLGAGSMGAVFLMRQLKLNRRVAVKVVRSEQFTYEETKRLMREARLLASLNHPGILTVHDVGMDGTVPYIVCEYVEGETLAARIERDPPLTVSQIVRIALHMLDGLKAAHKAGIIHRDLKPGNIFLSSQGRPKIGDFGLAKSQQSPSGSQSGRIQGTPPYMSPEQCRGHGITQLSDLYSVGCILFEMATGVRAFNGPTVLDFMTQHASVPPPRMRSLRADLPEALEYVVERALEKLPERRYKSASAFRKDLLELYRGLTPSGAGSEAPARPLALSAAPGVVLCQRYELVRLLGQGGMGQVWLAKDRVMDGAEVAIKILPPELWRDVDAQTNLKHEAKLSQKLAHPNVVRLMTLEPGDAPVLVMEYVPGQTLAQALGRRKTANAPFTPEEAWPILDGLASALDHAHTKGLVHRDIKPSNVLLETRPDGTYQAKLADFGIAAEVTSFRTRVTGVVPTGTLNYMSPEQVACRKLDGRSDVYALAATIYQTLTFEPPFQGDDVSQQIQSRAPMMPATLNPRLAQTLSRALAKKPEERFATAGEFAMAFFQATDLATNPGRPSLGTQESLSFVGRATRKTRALVPEPVPEESPPVNPYDPRLHGLPQGAPPWTAVVFSIGTLLLGAAALIYVLQLH